MVNKIELRKALRKVPKSVSLLTTKRLDRTVQTLTISSFTSITLDPPLILVSIGNSRKTFPYVKTNRTFAINVLCEDQSYIAEYYSRPDYERDDDDLVDFEWSSSGIPIVKNCLVLFECKVEDEYLYGDHTIFISRVLGTTVNDGTPLIHYNQRLVHLA